MHERTSAYVPSHVLAFLAMPLLLLALFIFPSRTLSASSTPITGYAWSDNIGWISFNCSNNSSCGTSNYGLSIATDGTISGYAWSDNIGWVSAQSADVSGCPSAPCAPMMNLTTGAWTGWFRALSNGGGWDGWISLSGSGYGPVLNGGTVSGYAWGSDVVGWVDFSYASSTYSACVPNSDVCLNGTTQRHYNSDCSYVDAVCQFSSYGYGCSSNSCQVPPSPAPDSSIPGGIQVRPKLVLSGKTTQVSWNIHNADPASCTVTGSNGDYWSGLAVGTKTSSPIHSQTTYLLHCNGSAVPILTFDAQATVNIAPTFRER